MAERIVFADGTTFACPVSAKAPVGTYPAGRTWKKIAVIATAEAAKETFVNGAVYRREWDSIVVREDGTAETVTNTQDLSAYSVAGDVVDTRDGSVTVYMGLPTETEKLQKTINEQADVIAILEGEAE